MSFELKNEPLRHPLHPVLALTRALDAESLLSSDQAFGAGAGLTVDAFMRPQHMTMPGLSLASPMTKCKPTRRLRVRSTARLAGIALALAAAMSLHSCTELPARRELPAAGTQLQALLTNLGTAVRQRAGLGRLQDLLAFLRHPGQCARPARAGLLQFVRSSSQAGSRASPYGNSNPNCLADWNAPSLRLSLGKPAMK